MIQIPVDLFDFDCPSTYFDLSAGRDDRLKALDDAWFHQAHPLHEPQKILAKEDGESTSTKRVSVLKAGGSNLRVPQTNRKAEVIENLPAPSKTTAVVTTFPKTTTGKKRSLPHSNDTGISSVKKNTTEPIIESLNNMKDNKISTPGGSSGGSMCMSSKLEEYRQKKSAQLEKKKIVTTEKKPSAKNVTTKKSAAVVSEDQAMLDMLKKHNEKFAAVPLYEPPRHSVRDVRKWEKLNGKAWSSLSPEEREVANKQISALKSK